MADLKETEQQPIVISEDDENLLVPKKVLQLGHLLIDNFRKVQVRITTSWYQVIRPKSNTLKDVAIDKTKHNVK